MTVVAEGVETDSQRDQLAELGADYGQGYYYARPMPAVAIEDLLREPFRGGTLRLPALAA